MYVEYVNGCSFNFAPSLVSMKQKNKTTVVQCIVYGQKGPVRFLFLNALVNTRPRALLKNQNDIIIL